MTKEKQYRIPWPPGTPIRPPRERKARGRKFPTPELDRLISEYLRSERRKAFDVAVRDMAKEIVDEICTIRDNEKKLKLSLPKIQLGKEKPLPAGKGKKT